MIFLNSFLSTSSLINLESQGRCKKPERERDAKTWMLDLSGPYEYRFYNIILPARCWALSEESARLSVREFYELSMIPIHTSFQRFFLLVSNQLQHIFLTFKKTNTNPMNANPATANRLRESRSESPHILVFTTTYDTAGSDPFQSNNNQKRGYPPPRNTLSWHVLISR